MPGGEWLPQGSYNIAIAIAIGIAIAIAIAIAIQEQEEMQEQLRPPPVVADGLCPRRTQSQALAWVLCASAGVRRLAG